MPGDSDVEGKSDESRAELVPKLPGAPAHDSSEISAKSRDRSTSVGGRVPKTSSRGLKISRHSSSEARGSAVQDVHRVALRKLDEAIFGGNPETVNAVAAQMGDQDGAEVLALFQAGFVKSRGARWKTRRILDHVDMFFAVYDAMGRYLDEDKLVQFVGAITVRHRFQLLRRAVQGQGGVAVSRRMVSVFSKQGIDWTSDEKWKHYRRLLLGAVGSGSSDLFRSIIDILGGKDVVLAHEGDGVSHPQDGVHWSIRLLHTCCLRGDGEMFAVVCDTFPQVQATSLAPKWRLLDGTVTGGNVDVLQRVVGFMGGEVGFAALRGDDGASGHANQVIDLMRGAIRERHVVMLRELSKIFQLGPLTADLGGVGLLKTAILTGRVDILGVVINILGNEAPRVAGRCKESLLKAAVRAHDADVLERVVEILGKEGAKAGGGMDGVSLLGSAVRSRDDAVVDRIIDIMGKEAVEAATRKAGVIIFRSAVATGKAGILKRVAGVMTESTLKTAVQQHEASLLGFAIRSGDEAVVDLVVKIMGQAKVSVAVEEGGASLLRSAIRVRSVKALNRVAEIMGDTAVKAASKQDGDSLLKAAIAWRDVDLIECLTKIMGDEAVSIVVEKAGRCLLRSAVRCEDAAVVDLVVRIMSDPVVAAVVEKDGESLLKAAVADGNVAVVQHVMDMLGDKELKTAAENHGMSLLGSAIRGGDDQFVDRVLKILENPAVKIGVGEREESRLKSALAAGDAKSAEGVVDLLRDTCVKLPPEEDGVALLRSTIAGDNLALVLSVAQMLHKTGVTISTEEDGISLVRSAIRSRNMAVIEQVFSLLGDKVSEIVPQMGRAAFLESAIRSHEVELVDCVVNFLGDEAVAVAAKENGFTLLETAFGVDDMVFVDRVLDILGETVVEIATGDRGTSLLQLALRTRDEVIFERLYGKVKDKVKIAAEDRGTLLTLAVESRNIVLLDRILSILGSTAVETTFKEHRHRILESAIWDDCVVSVRSISNIFGQSATEGGADTQSALSSAECLVYSDNTAVLDRVVEIMGEKAIKNEAKENGSALLRWAISGGDVAVLERVVDIIGCPAVRTIVEEGDESVLAFAIQSQDMAFFERIVESLGEETMSIAAENDGVSLLEDAIWTLDVVSVDRVADLLRDKGVKNALEKGGRFLLKSAIESRELALVDRVLTILGGEVLGSDVDMDGRSLFRAAIQSRDKDIVERVVDTLGIKAVECVARENGGSLLKTAIRSYDMAFLDRMVDILGVEAIKVALEKDGGALLESAIQSRDVAFLNRVVNSVGDAIVENAVKQGGASLLKCAVESRDVALVEDVIDIVRGANEASEDVQSLLGSVLAGGDVTAFGRIVDTLGNEGVSKVVKQAPQKDGLGLLATLVPAPDDPVAFVEGVTDALQHAVIIPKRVILYIRNGLRGIASQGAGGAGHCNEVLELLKRQTRDKVFVAHIMTEKSFHRHSESVLESAVKAENVEIVRLAMTWINRGLPQWEAVEAYTNALEVVQDVHKARKKISDRALEVLSLLLRFGASPVYDLVMHLISLGEGYHPKLRACFMDAVCLAPNPFVPGVSLAATLSEVAQDLPEIRRGGPDSIRQDLAKLLNEILEQLPKSVEACPGKTRTCLSLFEGQTTGHSLPTGFTGPLGVALRDRVTMEMLCSRPLVLDFMTYRFDVGSSASDVDSGQGRPIEERLLLYSTTFYKVPKWRMAFDVEIFIIFIYYFTDLVLLHDGEPGKYETAFIIYVAAALIAEVNEIRRDFRGYIQDRWNVLDSLAIMLMTAGWVVRMADSDSPAGRGLYALSAPLIFSRSLFFAEFLQFQGPMIHVIFSMTLELFQFGVVMVVVMLGFAVSFFALFRDSWDEYGYGDAWLDIFKAMLGELGLFEQMADEDQTVAGTVLLLVYLVVMTIMLLNLLIAVLSTAHSQVQEMNGVEYIVSKARVIQRYVLVVEKDLLPVPLNLVQLVIATPFRLVDVLVDKEGDKWYPRAKEHVGMVAFWLFSGPVIIIAGTLKSLVGCRMYEAIKAHRAKQRTEASWRNVFWLPFRLLIATPIITPIDLLRLWIVGGAISLVRFFRSLGGQAEAPKAPGSPQANGVHVRYDVSSLMKGSRAGLSVAELQEKLDDPMNDPEVRHDEREQAVKVEHLKLLRDRLEKTSASETRPLWEAMKRMDDRVGNIEKMMRVIADKMDPPGQQTNPEKRG